MRRWLFRRFLSMCFTTALLGGMVTVYTIVKAGAGSGYTTLTAPRPTPVVTVTMATPSPSPTDFWPAGTTPTASPVPTATPAPTPAPTALPEPPPVVTTTQTPTRATGAAWTQQLCAHEEYVMQQDINLDTYAETADPAYTAYYATAVAHWHVVMDAMLSGPCASPPATWTDVQCIDPLIYLEIGQNTHKNKELHFGKTAWDDTWIANYQEIIDLWRVGPGCQI